MLLQEKTLTHSILDGWWTDAGTFESLLRATNMVSDLAPTKFPGAELLRGTPQFRSDRLHRHWRIFRLARS